MLRMIEIVFKIGSYVRTKDQFKFVKIYSFA